MVVTVRSLGLTGITGYEVSVECVLVYSTSQYSVRKRISACDSFPAPVYECVACLSRTDRVQHNRHIACRGVLHTDRNIHSA